MPSTLTENDLLDLHGKVAIVTGANGGVGYSTVQWLASKGCKVYIASRGEERAQAAIKTLQEEGINDGTVHWLELDLSDPKLAKKAGEAFLEKEQRLDILVNNAAMPVVGPFSHNKDGLLDMMVVNHFSHVVLTNTVLPLMKATAKEPGADVRIVTVSSMVHADIKPTTFVGKESMNHNYGTPYSEAMKTYATTKVVNILYSKQLQKRFKAEGVPITCISLHPGIVNTPGCKTVVGTIPMLGAVLKKVAVPLFFSSPRQGSMNSAFAAAGKEVANNRAMYEGAYLMPVGKITQSSSSALDDRLGEEMYATTEEILKELGL